MRQPLEILKEYWGFNNFRPVQQDIITAVTEGKDTLALLPTGGGKSICYQVPAMAMDGICIVISPLVALINDQVNALKSKGIKAVALTGGLKFEEVDSLLDNCVYGNFKFLYLSPERLRQPLVQERIRQMPVNLLAIDEAHCISHWGNDFRPAYRECAVLRTIHPRVPLIALTASATQKVEEDILSNLAIKDGHTIRSSFKRENLAYMVFEEEDKNYKLLQILRKNPESSIVYVRNRKATVSISEYLIKNNIKATNFHGGLSSGEKDDKLKKWLNDEIQVMVSTNAFGMGIDKPDVKTVIHMNLPDSLESYFQEAGRAGRNGEKAFAVILRNKADEQHLKNQFLSVLPDVEFIKLLYRKLCNYFQISYGEGENETYTLNFNHFCSTYQLNPILAYNGLKLLDRNSVISITENFNRKNSIQFITTNRELFAYLDRNRRLEAITQAILRSYGGIFDIMTAVNTLMIAQKTAASEEEVIRVLEILHNDHIIEYRSQSTDTEITFLLPREDDSTINVIARDIRQQNTIKQEQVKAVIAYTNNNSICKSKQLLQYFGDKKSTDCRICSVCIAKKKKGSTSDIIGLVAEQLVLSLSQQPMSSRRLSEVLPYQDHCIIQAIQILLEEQRVGINDKNEYYIIE